MDLKESHWSSDRTPPGGGRKRSRLKETKNCQRTAFCETWVNITTTLRGTGTGSKREKEIGFLEGGLAQRGSKTVREGVGLGGRLDRKRQLALQRLEGRDSESHHLEAR
jgi:hypothetical protein